jgi:16S rRNA (cytosine1402-N4)-methyltransferase
MRMNAQIQLSAADLLNKENETKLIYIFSTYGEVRNTKTLVRAILEHREHRPFMHTKDLVQVADRTCVGHRNRYLSQVFQALRIAVNDEMGALEAFLEQSLEVLNPGGRLVVMTYHSVEDRLVKRFMKTGFVSGTLEKDEYGRIYRPFEVKTKKPIVPTANEISRNRRARSAKLRIAERRNVQF